MNYNYINFSQFPSVSADPCKDNIKLIGYDETTGREIRTSYAATFKATIDKLDDIANVIIDKVNIVMPVYENFDDNTPTNRKVALKVVKNGENGVMLQFKEIDI